MMRFYSVGAQVLLVSVLVFLGNLSNSVAIETPSPLERGDFLQKTDVYEKDYPIRSIGALNITNSHGNIFVKGWAFDKVRVRVLRKYGEQRSLEQLGYQYYLRGDDIHIVSLFTPETGIKDRIELKGKPEVQLDFEIFAPPRLPLKIWSKKGKVSLSNWKKKAFLRMSEGKIVVSQFSGSDLTLLCPGCEFELEDIDSKVRCIGGNETLKAERISGGPGYFETKNGRVFVRDSSARQTWVTSGDFRGVRLGGETEIRTTSGNIDATDVSGAFDAYTVTGNVQVNLRSDRELDRLNIESVDGEVRVMAPRSLSANLDAWSLSGDLTVDFPVRRESRISEPGPHPGQRVQGKVFGGGATFRLYSEKGSVFLFRGVRR